MSGMPPGYVYFIEDTQTGLIKVGVSRDPLRRLEMLAREFRRPMRLLGASLGGMSFARLFEERLHMLLVADNARGEWFRPSEKLTACIEACHQRPVRPSVLGAEHWILDQLYEARMELPAAQPLMDPAQWSPEALAYWGEWSEVLQ